MSAKTLKRKRDLLFTLKGPLKVSAYRGKFRAFATTKYLDVRALKNSKKKISIECGTVEADGKSFTLVADIHRGQVLALRPIACAECHDGNAKSRKVSAAVMQKTMQAVAKELERRKIAGPKLPMALRVNSALGFSIPLGPIVITIGDIGGEGWDACITVYIPGFNICWCCIFSGCRCYDMP